MQYHETLRRGGETSRPCPAERRRAQVGQNQLQKASCTVRSSNHRARCQPVRPLLAGRPLPQRGAERNPVVTFLQEIGLSQYADPLLQDGFDDMETLLAIEQEHLKAAGFLPGHILKLKKHLNKLQMPEASPPCPARAVLPYPSAAEAPAKPRSQLVPSRQTIDAVQKSWLVVRDLGVHTVAEILYRHLFKIAPETKALFPMSVRMRHHDWTSGEIEDVNDFENSPALRNLFAKVVGAVGSAVAGLQNIGKLVPELNALGMRHINYNMKEEYFEFGGQALVLTLQDGLGDLLTAEVQQAWISVYDFISATIICGLQSARAQQEALSKLTQPSSQQQAAAPLPVSTPAALDAKTDIGPGQIDLGPYAAMESSSAKCLQKPVSKPAAIVAVPRPVSHTNRASPMVPSGHTISAVQQSWLVVKELGTGTVGEILYRHLFSIAPETKKLFPMSVRSRYLDWTTSAEEDEGNFINSPALRNLFSKVVDAVGTAVAGLHNISKLVPELNALGMRHINYNMEEEYFEFGGQALVLTLQDGLGSMLTEDVKQAWISVYDFISASIISGLKFAREREALLKTIRHEARSQPLTPASTMSGGSLTTGGSFHESSLSDMLTRLEEPSLSEYDADLYEAQPLTLQAVSKAETRVATLREKRVLARSFQSDIVGRTAS